MFMLINVQPHKNFTRVILHFSMFVVTVYANEFQEVRSLQQQSTYRALLKCRRIHVKWRFKYRWGVFVDLLLFILLLVTHDGFVLPTIVGRVLLIVTYVCNTVQDIAFSCETAEVFWYTPEVDRLYLKQLRSVRHICNRIRYACSSAPCSTV